MATLSLDDRLNGTAKEHLFGNLGALRDMVKNVEPRALLEEMERRIDAALSWEPLIVSADADALVASLRNR